jgi:4-hydroxybenzoate polyprenyltransferase
MDDGRSRMVARDELGVVGDGVRVKRSLLGRLWEYQAERFPLGQHGPLILAFTFSAASYSRIVRGAPGFITAIEFIVGAISSLGLFMLLRVFDEFKDADEDAAHRPYRPVPRGLVTLGELRWVGIAIVAVAIALNAAVMPVMLLPWLAALGYMLLMAREFFVRDWLKAHPIIYMVSHMIVLPMIDFYTTGLDWINRGVPAPDGIKYFLLLTFLNGIVIEVGRKIRAPEAEEPGVETYSALYGPWRSTLAWLGALAVTFSTAVIAASHAGFGTIGFILLLVFLLASATPALLFLRSRDQRHAKRIELAAGVWTIAIYLTLGGVPMVIRLFD